MTPNVGIPVTVAVLGLVSISIQRIYPGQEVNG